MDPHRKFWNEQHKKLKVALERGQNRKIGIDLFLAQHAMVHSALMSKSKLHSFEDEVLYGLSEEAIRRICGNHSIAWVIWHLARIEDVTMNLLLGDGRQVLTSEDHDIGIKTIHTGNGMSRKEIGMFSSRIDIEALKKYRMAVGRATRKTVNKLHVEEFNRKIDPPRLQRIWDQGAMLPNARGIVEYWAGRTAAGLLLMPPTRHAFLHLNETRRLRALVEK